MNMSKFECLRSYEEWKHLYFEEEYPIVFKLKNMNLKLKAVIQKIFLESSDKIFIRMKNI